MPLRKLLKCEGERKEKKIFSHLEVEYKKKVPNTRPSRPSFQLVNRRFSVNEHNSF